MNGLAKKIGIKFHIPSISGFCVELPAHVMNRSTLPFAVGSHKVQQGFDLGVVRNHLSMTVDIDQVIGVKAVVLEDVYCAVAVSQGKDDPWDKTGFRAG